MKKPAKCISVEEAREQQEQWVKTRGKVIESNGKFKDFRDFWYSLDELQGYLDYVREKSKEQGIEKPGIRFYLGAYPPSKNEGKTTVFLSPTQDIHSSIEKNEEASNPNNYKIDPFNTIATGWPPTIY